MIIARRGSRGRHENKSKTSEPGKGKVADMPDSFRQTLILTDRKELRLDGVEDVAAFDDSSVLLKTNRGLLDIEGDGLRILRFDGAESGGPSGADPGGLPGTGTAPQRGNICISGRITSLSFIDRSGSEQSGANGSNGGFFSRRRKREG